MEASMNINMYWIKGHLSWFCVFFRSVSYTHLERRTAYAEMLLSPVMHTDCTNARENGQNCQVYVCVTPDGKDLYFARKKKGHEGVKGTVTEDYQGILVHDHDLTFCLLYTSVSSNVNSAVVSGSKFQRSPTNFACVAT